MIESSELSGYLSPEAELVVCCAAQGAGADRRERLRQLAAAALDWETVMALAGRHAVIPLVYTQLAEAGIAYAAPASVVASLRQAFEQNAHSSLHLAAELTRIAQQFGSEGLPVIAYKGPVSAVELYGNLALRQFSDIDLLVDGTEVGRATAILAASGYLSILSRAERVPLDADCERQLENADGSVTIDLHWDFAQPHLAIGSLPAAWRERTRQLEIAGVSITTFGLEDTALVLVIHGGKHYWERIAWVADLAALLFRNPGLDWEALLAAARAMRATNFLLLGATLAHSLCSAPVPAFVLEQAESAAVRKYARRILATYSSKRISEAGFLARWGYLLGIRENWSDKARSGLRFSLRPTTLEIQALDLPRRARFLYPFVRVGNLLRRVLRAAAGTAASAPRTPAAGKKVSAGRD